MTKEVTVTVYRITGKQLFFNVKNSFCEECELSVRQVREVAKELANIKVKLEIKPWLNHILKALFKGGYHPPVVLVDGKIVSQGIVPDRETLKKAILAASARAGIPIKQGPVSS